jgi:hypothetical protein
LTSKHEITFDAVTDGNGKRSIRFLCDVIHNESNIYIDVTWMIGDVIVKEEKQENAILYNDLPAVLYESEWSSKAKLQNQV